jgi:hypothetical protein
MKEEKRNFEMLNIDAAWEKFQQRIRQERIVPLIAGPRGNEKKVLLSGKTEDKEISFIVWLDEIGTRTFLILELQAKSEKYDGQSVGINLPTATASIVMEEYEALEESLEIEWEKDPSMNIPSAPLVKGKATQTTLGVFKKPISEQLRKQLEKFLQPVELTFPQG